MKQTDKARLGAIGEHLVTAKLLQHGWDTFNANLSIKNTKSYDLVVCTNSESTATAFVQVKTTVGKSFPVGMTIAGARNREVLEAKIVGPWVFVYASGEAEKMQFRYFILTRAQMIRLLKESHDWYVAQWNRGDRTINENAPAAIPLKWLQGYGEPENAKHRAFDNPLQESSENCWDNICK